MFEVTTDSADGTADNTPSPSWDDACPSLTSTCPTPHRVETETFAEGDTAWFVEIQADDGVETHLFKTKGAARSFAEDKHEEEGRGCGLMAGTVSMLPCETTLFDSDHNIITLTEQRVAATFESPPESST